MDRTRVTLWNVTQATGILRELWMHIKSALIAGHRLVVEVKPETRSIKQNSLMWSCLTDLSEQVQWCGKKLTPEGWKDFITGHIEGQDLIPNMHGTGFISINRGRSTSNMTIKEMTAVIDLCHAFGAERGVTWKQTSIGVEYE